MIGIDDQHVARRVVLTIAGDIERLSIVAAADSACVDRGLCRALLERDRNAAAGSELHVVVDFEVRARGLPVQMPWNAVALPAMWELRRVRGPKPADVRACL